MIVLPFDGYGGVVANTLHADEPVAWSLTPAFGICNRFVVSCSLQEALSKAVSETGIFGRFGPPDLGLWMRG